MKSSSIIAKLATLAKGYVPVCVTKDCIRFDATNIDTYNQMRKRNLLGIFSATTQSVATLLAPKNWTRLIEVFSLKLTRGVQNKRI